MPNICKLTKDKFTEFRKSAMATAVDNQKRFIGIVYSRGTTEKGKVAANRGKRCPEKLAKRRDFFFIENVLLFTYKDLQV